MATSRCATAPLAGGNVSGAQVAEMIDELPMLAALGPFTEKGIEIHDAKELRVKESDRIVDAGRRFAPDGSAGGGVCRWDARRGARGRQTARRENRSAG